MRVRLKAMRPSTNRHPRKFRPLLVQLVMVRLFGGQEIGGWSHSGRQNANRG